MSSKQRRIKRKLNIIAKVYRQYVRTLHKPRESLYMDQEHRSRVLYSKHGEKINARWLMMAEHHV